MSFLSPTQIIPISANPPSLPVGKTVLAIGVVPNLATSVYNTPYLVTDLLSAANFFGIGSFTRALGELIRQKAGAVVAIATYQYSDIPPILDLFRSIQYDVLLPVGVLANTQTLGDLTPFVTSMCQQDSPIICAMAADPTPGVASLVANPVGAICGTYNDGLNTNTSLARNFVFTLDTVTINPNVPSQYQASVCASIAGLMASTSPQTSLANTTLTGLAQTTLYSTTDAANLSNAGYTVLRYTARKGVTPYLAVTGTSTNSSAGNYTVNFHNLSSIRTFNYIVVQIKNLLTSLIGSSNTTNVTKNVTNLMDSIKASGIIIQYTLNVNISAVLGQVYVNLAILPYNETQFIQISQQVNLNFT